ncbi:26S proteasome non-ATPase regulatory subunit 2-like protein [Dinothrombium tinctorium]|uniref:26S proteasome non-ATPase regulatory subunit 2-like protein n=1 Tax=Dinothrombium tinctorium TaxID=1965070 RepID=A0A443R6C5_9ACAR|nr:26S proteasome non-ATPase regulatory subunit 2-like protein [Dinothrombium tinctorium]
MSVQSAERKEVIDLIEKNINWKEFEDQGEERIKLDIELLFKQLNESDQSLYLQSLKAIVALVKESTSRLFSMPAVLKILKPHFEHLKFIYEKLEQIEERQIAADILSLIATVQAGHEVLKYRLLGTHSFKVSFWGHEYVTHLVRDVIAIFKERKKLDKDALKISKDVLKYLISQNAVSEAVDFVIEINQIHLLEHFVENEDTAAAVCNYLKQIAIYTQNDETLLTLNAAFKLYKKFNNHIEALLLSLKVKDTNTAKQLLLAVEERAMQKQLVCLAAKHQLNIDGIEDEELLELLTNEFKRKVLMEAAKILEISKPKNPFEVIEKKRCEANLLRNLKKSRNSDLLEWSIINGFLNCAFASDTLFASIEFEEALKLTNDRNNYISIIASLGLIYRWHTDKGTNEIEKYLNSKDCKQKCGAILALCVMNQDRNIEEILKHLNAANEEIKIATIMGLGILFAGQNRADILDELKMILKNVQPNGNLVIYSTAALSCGLVALGSANKQLLRILFHALLELDIHCLNIENNFNCWFILLAMGFCFFGRSDKASAIITLLYKIPNKILREMAKVLIAACVYFGSGNMLKIQEFLQICAQKPIRKRKKFDETDTNTKEMKRSNRNKSDMKQIENMVRTISSCLDSEASSDKSTNRSRTKSLKKTKAGEKRSTISDDLKRSIESIVTSPVKSDFKFNQKQPKIGENQIDLQQRTKSDHLKRNPPIKIISSFENNSANLNDGSSEKMKQNLNFTGENSKNNSMRTEQKTQVSKFSMKTEAISSPKTPVFLNEILISSKLEKKAEDDIKKCSKEKSNSVKSIKAQNKRNSSSPKLPLPRARIVRHSISYFEPFWRKLIDFSSNSLTQAFAVLGIGAVSMGEEISTQMAVRMCSHFFRFASSPVKRTTPLILAFLFLSNPQPTVVQMLQKHTLDLNLDFAANCIIALGFVGAGTNNDKIAAHFRELAAHYKRNTELKRAIRISQALLYLGKGCLSLSPHQFDNELTKDTSAASVLIALLCCFDIRNTLLGKLNFLLYYLTPAIQSKVCATFDENLKAAPITVRVGKRVDTTGKVGKQRSIAGFRTLTTPMLLSIDQRAEIASDEYRPLTPIIEHNVILRKI